MSYIGDREFYLEVAKGNIPGYSIVNKFGQNDDVGTGAYEDIWDGGGTYTYPADSTADITEVVSTSASDTGDVEIQGLSSDGTLTVQTETLTGTTPVTLTTPLWRVFRMKNVGTATFVGDVTCENTGNTVEYAKVQIGNNQTLMALYTIPKDKAGYLLETGVSLAGIARGYSMAVRMAMRPFGLVFQLKATNGLDTDGTSFASRQLVLPSAIPAKTDIQFSAKSSSAGGIINARFSLLLIDD